MEGSRHLAFWFAIGLLAGLAGSFALVRIVNVQHI
jgi:hypothetical protein